MMDRVLSRENLIHALRRVERNKGSHGVDGMPVQNLRRHVTEHWATLQREARKYISQGYRWVVDMDLENFFDKVNHDRLMRILSKRVKDPNVLRLIRRYLQAGIMENGLVRPNTEGAPQGGPLSPLLSNIVLDELDKELGERGLRFVRYADDCNIYVRSRRAGVRVRESITQFIEKKLKLKVNEEKSAVDRPWKRKFLGFSFTIHKEPKVRIAKESIKRLHKKIREITSRKMPYPMEYRIRKLNQYLMGWCGYFALADTSSIFKQLDSLIRRRLRMCLWKNWKKIKTKYRNLIRLGTPTNKAWEWANSRKGYWRISKSPILHRNLGNSYWSYQGLKSLYNRYEALRQLS